MFDNSRENNILTESAQFVVNNYFDLQESVSRVSDHEIPLYLRR